MTLNFSEVAYPIFRATSPFERGELKSKGGGKKPIHFNGSEENIEFILRTIISANRLSIYGAEQTCSGNYPNIPEHQGNLMSMNIWKRWKFLLNIPSNPDHHTHRQQQGNLLLDYERKFEQLCNDQKLSKLYLDAGLKSVEIRQFFITHDAEEGPDEMKNSCRECTRPRNGKRTVARGWFVGETTIGPVLD